MLKSGETLNVHTGGKLTTGDKLTLEDGAALYLEGGATLDKYQDVNGYKDGNGSQILHEAHSQPENPGDAETTCTICGSPVPHKWRKDWEYNGTHHWHECDSDDCSVLAEAVECSITDNSKKGGYGEHKFGAPAYEYSTLTFTCEDCGYTYSVDKDKISIIKVGKDGESEEPLENAEFWLYSDEECTDKVGEAASVKTEYGTKAVAVFNITKGINLDKKYYIKETAAPTGYAKSDTVYTIEIQATESDEIEVTVTYGTVGSAATTTDIPECVNEKVDIKTIQIIKVDEENNFLAGAKFGLYSDASCQTQVGTGTSSSDGTVSFDTTDVNKTYYIKEIAAPEGYTASEEVFKAVVDENGKVTYGDAGSEEIPVCENYAVEVISDPVKIIKADGETGEPLAGAQFGLYSDENCQTQVGTGTSSSDGTVSFDTTDVNKTYYIKEIAAPEGYTASEEVFTASVGADGKVTYGAAGSEEIPVCENYKITPAPIALDPIQIIKVDGKTNAPLAGAEFSLYGSDNVFITTGTTAINSDNNAVVSFTAGIELNKMYYIKETQAPEGYTASEEVFTAIVGADGKVTYGAAGSEEIPVCKNYPTTPDESVTPPYEPTTPVPTC